MFETLGGFILFVLFVLSFAVKIMGFHEQASRNNVRQEDVKHMVI